MTKISCFLQLNKNSLNPFKRSEMILNYNGKMIDEVNRTEGDLQTTEDDQQTTEDDRGMTEDDQNLQTNKASLNQFECSEMMNYKGMIDGGSSSAVCRSSSIVCRSSSVVCRSPSILLT